MLRMPAESAAPAVVVLKAASADVPALGRRRFRRLVEFTSDEVGR